MVSDASDIKNFKRCFNYIIFILEILREVPDTACLDIILAFLWYM